MVILRVNLKRKLKEKKVGSQVDKVLLYNRYRVDLGHRVGHYNGYVNLNAIIGIIVYKIQF